MIMRKNIGLICVAVLTAVGLQMQAGEAPSAPKSSAEFAKLKALVGTWQGQTDMGQGPVDMTVQYRLLAGGTVLEERCFPGQPHEMVTMFYDKNGKLALTHYCVMGNRPGMTLDSAEGNMLKFAFDDSCGINVKKETHMHALSLRLDDANTITASCKAVMEGKEMAEKPVTLKRVSSVQ
jgi:hypothetical protein